MDIFLINKKSLFYWDLNFNNLKVLLKSIDFMDNLPNFYLNKKSTPFYNNDLVDIFFKETLEKNLINNFNLLECNNKLFLKKKYYSVFNTDILIKKYFFLEYLCFFLLICGSIKSCQFLFHI